MKKENIEPTIITIVLFCVCILLLVFCVKTYKLNKEAYQLASQRRVIGEYEECIRFHKVDKIDIQLGGFFKKSPIYIVYYDDGQIETIINRGSMKAEYMWEHYHKKEVGEELCAEYLTHYIYNK